MKHLSRARFTLYLQHADGSPWPALSLSSTGMRTEEQLHQLELRLRHTLEFVEIDQGGQPIEKRYLISRIGNVKIEIYPDEHPPPHFHIKSPDLDATFEIVTCNLLMGHVDSQTKKKILYFHSTNKSTLIDVWNKLRPENCRVGRILV